MKKLIEFTKSKTYDLLAFINNTTFLIVNTLSWETLRDIEKNKIVRSTYIWLFIVPILAKSLSKLEDTIKFNINDQIITIDLSMPFSWQALFFSACFFVLANILVSLTNPEIIKKYASFSEFNDAGKTNKTLEEYKIFSDLEKKESLNKLKKLMGVKESTEKSDKFKDEFNSVYLAFSYSKPWLRATCSALYLIGFLFIIDIVYKNIVWVLSSMNLTEFKEKLFFGQILDWAMLLL